VQNGVRDYNTALNTAFFLARHKLATSQQFAVFALLRER